MALDSNGNIAVDFAWGNFPLQPDAVRGGDAIAEYTIIDADEKTGVQRFTFYGTTAPLVGTEFTVVVNPDYTNNMYPSPAPLAGTYVVTATENQPNGVYVKTSTPFKQYVLGSITMPVGTAVVDPAKNFGGGAGDAGWSKTTQKKSAVLDPTLDGHNIATEFWNNFPDYTPNAGFVPQQLFEFTVVGNNNYNAAINLESNSDDPYEGTRRGYILTFNGQAISAEKSAELLALIQSSQLAGERVPAFSFPDSYGNTVTAPQGWIVGADFTPGMYGDTSFSIQIATADNAFNTGVVYIPVGTTITLGVGAPKTVLFEGKLGTDFANAYGMLNSDTLNGIPPYYNITSSANAQFPAEFLAAVNSGSLVGAWIGVGPVEEFGPYNNGAYYPRQNIMKINNAFVTQDMYGNSLVRVEGSYSWAAGGTEAFYLYETGAQIVIVK